MEKEIAKLPDGELIIQMAPQKDVLFLLSNMGNVYLINPYELKLIKIVEGSPI